jgi:hypothetical protein
LSLRRIFSLRFVTLYFLRTQTACANENLKIDYYRMLAAFESLDVSRIGLPDRTGEDFRAHREAEEYFEVAVLQAELEAEEKWGSPSLSGCAVMATRKYRSSISMRSASLWP